MRMSNPPRDRGPPKSPPRLHTGAGGETGLKKGRRHSKTERSFLRVDQLGMGADLPDFFPQGEKICKSERLLPRVAQEGGGMEGSIRSMPFFSTNTPCSLVTLKFGSMRRQAATRPRQTRIFGRRSAACSLSQPMQASCSSGKGSRVFGRAAFHDVGDIQVILPGQADSGQHFIQKLATPPDKGFPLGGLRFHRGPRPRGEPRRLVPPPRRPRGCGWRQARRLYRRGSGPQVPRMKRDGTRS